VSSGESSSYRSFRAAEDLRWVATWQCDEATGEGGGRLEEEEGEVRDSGTDEVGGG
jgi:hypothetical protein